MKLSIGDRVRSRLGDRANRWIPPKWTAGVVEGKDRYGNYCVRFEGFKSPRRASGLVHLGFNDLVRIPKPKNNEEEGEEK